MSCNKKVTIWCSNDNTSHEVEAGVTLAELVGGRQMTDERTGKKSPVLAALVDHELKPLCYQLLGDHKVEFIGYYSAYGRNCYIRSLCFVLQKAVRDLFPDKVLKINHSLPSGLYCELRDGKGLHFVSDEDIEKIKDRMTEIVKADYPFTRAKVLAEDAVKIFENQNQPNKANLLRSIGRFSIYMYYLDGVADSFHGPLVPSTAMLYSFDVSAFSEGFCLQLPQTDDFSKKIPMKRQSKISEALIDNSKWCSILGIGGVGSLNDAIGSGKAVQLINISEARAERKYAEIANEVAARRGQVKIVFIAGPSSSGKTSSSLRLAQQCKILGLNPKVIELDNYFVDRDKTPLDENGEYDFESLYAMDLELLGNQLNALLAGEEVEIPVFDFKAGARKWSGKKMRLEQQDILIMEGIHALNPEMVPSVNQSRVMRVYVSALTSLNLDENNSLSTSDNRLLRRMVRDNRTRGITPENTILRWHSVRRGESRNIFPFQENADVIFNSALLFELPLLKYYAEPLLRRILPSSPAYPEALRLLKLLNFIKALQPSEIEAVPPTSIMREFIGGQTL